ncbi:MAG: cyclic nucleotide-binding domain-containing protein, partial [Gemmatimonadetes bacterium]|nr:cyclic nucleotide-binding domain-containing protein [Gemmatimonadota bacterium]
MNIDQIFQELDIKDELVSVDLGTVVFNQGQLGDHLYIVKSGRLRVLQEDEEGEAETVGYLYEGDHFGEGALLTGKGHRATVRATEDSEVLRINSEDFQRALKNDPELRAYFEDQVAHIAYRNFTRFLRGESDQTSAEAMQHLFGNLKRQTYQSDETVVKQGDVGSGLYLIGGGELEAVGQDGKTIVLNPGDFFGDQALID